MQLHKLRQFLDEQSVAQKQQEIRELEMSCASGHAYIAGLREALNVFEDSETTT